VHVTYQCMSLCELLGSPAVSQGNWLEQSGWNQGKIWTDVALTYWWPRWGEAWLFGSWQFGQRYALWDRRASINVTWLPRYSALLGPDFSIRLEMAARFLLGALWLRRWQAGSSLEQMFFLLTNRPFDSQVGCMERCGL
jgi:hypothetical protein